MANRDVAMSLEEAVGEVLTILTGLDLEYDPGMERFHSISRCLNKAMRSTALDHEWSYFSSTENIGRTRAGMRDVELNPRQRMRIINDDAIRLNDRDGVTRQWCYLLPRDALHKYLGREGIWAAVTRSTITFSRPFLKLEEGLDIVVPVMREPRMFEIPRSGEAVDDRVLRQTVDFDYPDLVIARAAYIYAQTDPVMQPRVQTLEQEYKTIMYALVERDDRHTDSAYLNDFTVPIQNSIRGSSWNTFPHIHPHADDRYM